MFGVATGCMATYSARVALPICAVKISEELGLTKEEQGIILGCFFWGYVLTQVGFWAGALSGRLFRCVRADFDPRSV